MQPTYTSYNLAELQRRVYGDTPASELSYIPVIGETIAESFDREERDSYAPDIDDPADEYSWLW